MTTGTVLVQDALSWKGVIPDDTAPSTAQLNVGLRWLNRMLSSWGNLAEMIYVISSDTFTTTPSVATYSTTVLSTPTRPIGVDSITMTLSNVTYDVELIDNQRYNAISYKPVDAIPTVCYYDANYPNANFNFYPRPFSTFTVQVECYRPLSGTVAAATDLTLPAGYEHAIVTNLGCLLTYGIPPTPQMRLEAKAAMDNIKRKNFVPLTLKLPFDREYSVNNDFPYRGF
jgi:hypothetical protein